MLARPLKLAIDQALSGRTIKLRMNRIEIEVAPCPKALSWMRNSDRLAMLVARPPDTRNEDAQLRLFALSHGFTSREIDVLLAYSQHCEVRKTAASLAMGYETARSRIKSALRKCGQPSLVHMMKAARDGLITN